MAKVSRAVNSNADLPRNSVRASSQAMSSPKAAHTGAAMADRLTVVKKEFHAVPAHTRPNSPHCRSKALRKGCSAKV